MENEENYYNEYPVKLRNELLRDAQDEEEKILYKIILRIASNRFKYDVRRGAVLKDGLIDVYDYASEAFLRYYAAKAAQKNEPLCIVNAKYACFSVKYCNTDHPFRTDRLLSTQHIQSLFIIDADGPYETNNYLNYQRVTRQIIEDDDFKETAKDLVERFVNTLNFNDYQLWKTNIRCYGDMAELCACVGAPLNYVQKRVYSINKRFIDFVLEHKHEYETETFILGAPKKEIFLTHDRKSNLEKKLAIIAKEREYAKKRKMLLKGGLE